MKRPDLPNLERAVARVTTRSALNPILWLSGIVTPISIILATTSSAHFAPWLLALGAIPVLVSITAYIYFMVKDPDRLQSEEYNLERQRIEHLGDNEAGERGASILLESVPVRRPDQDEGAAKP
ncbi:MAG: hypothetical protein ACMVO3_17095 [Thalassobaculum sp.]